MPVSISTCVGGCRSAAAQLPSDSAPGASSRSVTKSRRLSDVATDTAPATGRAATAYERRSDMYIGLGGLVLLIIILILVF